MFKRKLAYAVDYAKVAKEVIQEIPLYYDESKIWYKWNKNKNCWQTVDETEILNSIEEEFEIVGLYQTKLKNWLLNALQMESRKKKPKELLPTQIQFKNTIVDITTGETINASPEHFSFNPIPWELGTLEDTPNIDKVLESWVGKNQVVTLQEWIAYNMLNSYPIHRVACLTGTGSNGKTTFVKLMRKIVGNKNVSAGELDTVFLERFGLAYLYRKTGIVMGETNFQKLTRTGKFKSATGEDPIIIEIKNKMGFDYTNYAKITICTNSLPITEDKTDGFYRRWLIINFPNQFTEKNNILKGIPENEYSNFARKSLRLLKQLINNGKFTNEGNIEDRRQQYEKNSNPIQVFIEENITEWADGYVTKKEFSKNFRNWQKSKGYRVFTDVEIGKVMKQQYDMGWRYNKDNIRERSWLGILLKTENLNTYETINEPSSNGNTPTDTEREREPISSQNTTSTAKTANTANNNSITTNNTN